MNSLSFSISLKQNQCWNCSAEHNGEPGTKAGLPAESYLNLQWEDNRSYKKPPDSSRGIKETGQRQIPRDSASNCPGKVNANVQLVTISVPHKILNILQH